MAVLRDGSIVRSGELTQLNDQQQVFSQLD